MKITLDTPNGYNYGGKDAKKGLKDFLRVYLAYCVDKNDALNQKGARGGDRTRTSFLTLAP